MDRTGGAAGTHRRLNSSPPHRPRPVAAFRQRDGAELVRSTRSPTVPCGGADCAWRCVLIIEERRRTRLRWIRTTAAACAATAILIASVLLWRYGTLLGEEVDVGWVASIVGVVHLVGRGRLRGRERRADFHWRPALVLRGGVHPGLSAGWSRSAFAIDAVVGAGFTATALLHFGGRVGTGSRWYGPIGSVVAAAMAVALAVAAFRRLRCSGYLAVTSQGVAYRGRIVGWAQIRSVNRRKSGVYLRVSAPSEEPRYLEPDSVDCAVPDERVTEVIRFYLANPHRRIALDTGPERLALPTGQGSS